MKVLTIPDIHLKPWIFDEAAKILERGEADRAFCLMDIPDDWNMGFQIGLYEETFDKAIWFAKTYPSTLWCWGNHELSYLWGQLETGYSPYAEHIVLDKLDELSEFADPGIICRIDNVLFCHGGLTSRFVKQHKLNNKPIDQIISEINLEMRIKDLWNDESPLWFRPQLVRRKPYGESLQVVGHTPVKEIAEKKGFLSTDVFSTDRFGKQIGESAFAIVDTETKKWKKVNI